MHVKDACVIVNLREGQDLSQIPAMIGVLEAAGWKARIALKEYGGESMKLATKAAKDGYDLVVAYGGDGTLNQVVNGVLKAKGERIVGVIPGGTTNEWAGEITVPGDHVKAALTLVNSEARYVDLGHVEVQGLTFPDGTQSNQDQTQGKKTGKKKKVSGRTKEHFLLMAGLGIDAAIIAHTDKPLKYHFGQVAFDLAAIKELPLQHAFPIEVRVSGNGGHANTYWQGEAVQVIVANTRRYANVVEITPDAYLDDGLLDVLVITQGNPLTDIEQAASLLLRRKPGDTSSKFFRGSQISIRVPASIDMHLDGSAIDLKDYLSKSEQQALQQVKDIDHVMVNYQFTAEAHALQMAIPRTYNNTLFQHAPHEDTSQQKNIDTKDVAQRKQDRQQSAGGPQQQPVEFTQALVEQGYRVRVVGAVPNPDKQQTYIVAGNIHKEQTEETEPVAVRVDATTPILKQTGEHLPVAAIEKLQESEEIVVGGKKSKRGVIRATHVVI